MTEEKEPELKEIYIGVGQCFAERKHCPRCKKYSYNAYWYLLGAYGNNIEAETYICDKCAVKQALDMIDQGTKVLRREI